MISLLTTMNPSLSTRTLRLTLALLAVLCSSATTTAGERVFPGEHWQEKTPAELGLDPDAIDAVATALGSRGCIIKDGYVVKAWGSQSDRGDLFSSAKPILSTLLLFAVQEGKVGSLDARLTDFGWELAEKDRTMTFRHLGAMTSGYARPEKPGEAWAYNDYAIQLYQKTLFDRVFRDSPENVVGAPERFGALQLEEGLKFRESNRRISASVRDFARIAWLWLNRGEWNGNPLIDRALFDDCLQSQVSADTPNTQPAKTNDYLGIGTYGGESDHFSNAGPGIYGFNWWFNGRGPRHPQARAWPDAPPDTFMSLGLRGNCSVMMPSLGLVVVAGDADWGRNEPGDAESVINQRLRLIAYAGTPVAERTPEDAAAPPSATPASTAQGTVQGEQRVWYPLALEFQGPSLSEEGTPNPFTDYRLDVTFEQGERRHTVPGFFAADGRAAESGAAAGDCWQVRFTPEAPGVWKWRASFRTGKDVAIAEDASAGKPVAFDGAHGSLEVADASPHAAGALREGRLDYVGRRYWQFAGSQRYFLKCGADSPENLLAYDEFDGTTPTHRYGPHLLDFRPGDPTWRGGRGRNLIGALNYLASRGVNSIYFLTMNVRGDGQDVWPWTSDQERARFDVSKLDQWELVFTHMDRLGIAQHVVLQEQENDQLLDKGELGPQRRLYLRELVARFAHHPALVWNLGEENTNTDAQRIAHAEHLHALDAYDHPVVVHTFPKQQEKVYTPLLGNPAIEGVSLQTNDTREQTRRWIRESAVAGRPWVVCLDEIGPADVGAKPDFADYEHDELRRDHLWPHFMSGGAGVEWLFGYSFPHNDINLEDFRSRDHLWQLSRIAVDFLQRHLPFAEMQSADELTSNAENYCFAKPGEVYAIYLPRGGTTDLELPAGEYKVEWFNPRRGGSLKTGSVPRVTGPGKVSIGTSPKEGEADSVCLVTRVSAKSAAP
ncbi:MAG: DUF5060 domain-containing protein [Pirellulales bacterium]|nr:DUF5060 domain-containing protein [Pirellulales bacterium]